MTTSTCHNLRQKLLMKYFFWENITTMLFQFMHTIRNTIMLQSMLYYFISLSLINFANARTAEDPCIIKEFEEVSDAVKSCTNIILDSVSVPGEQSLTLKLKVGSRLVFRGTTTFGFATWNGPLIALSGTNISVVGEEGSVLDGQGPLWWDGMGGWGNVTKPLFMRIKVINGVLDGINMKNCPHRCVSIASNNLVIKNWKVDNLEGDEGVAKDNKFGHNTDGFGIGGGSENITIEDTIVYNQDDCVVVNSGKKLKIRNLFCHGSHGLSISASSATIEDVLFENSIVTMSENGLHVKTHIDAGEGLIKDVTYRNITMLDCKYYGINVQQNYVNLPADQPQNAPPKNNIPIHNLTISNIYGNVLPGGVPVYILCAENGCFDWKWENVVIYGMASDDCTNFLPEGYDC